MIRGQLHTSDALSLNHARLAWDLDELCGQLLVPKGEGAGDVGSNPHLVVRQHGVDSEVNLQRKEYIMLKSFHSNPELKLNKSTKQAFGSSWHTGFEHSRP